MNEYLKIIIEIILSSGIVLFFIKILGENFISYSFNKKMKKYEKSLNAELSILNASLDNKARRIQTLWDIESERLKFQYSTVFAKQLEIFQEILDRLNKIDELRNRLKSFHSYDCKLNIDFGAEDKCGKGCDKDCIVNYWNFVCEFSKSVHAFGEYVEANVMFFTLEQEVNLQNIIIELHRLRNNAFEKGLSPNEDANTRALNVFQLFEEYELKNLISLKGELINSFRKRIGTFGVDLN